MSEEEEQEEEAEFEDLLKPTQSIFMVDHADTRRIIKKLRPPYPPFADTPLYGRHVMVRPPLAMQAFRRLGPVRHALAQRMISGLIEIHAPWADMLAQGSAAGREKKKPKLQPRTPKGRR